jgi:uncharacterized protein (UPF0218 family)
MYEDLYPEKKKKGTVTVTDFDTNEVTDEYEVDIGVDGKVRRKRKKKINLYPKGQTTNNPARKISKKARDTMKRAMDIRKYIKEGEKDKE